MTIIMVKLFNVIFDSGLFPDTWTKGIIIPIHKHGPKDNPENYRGITLLPIFSKIYISVINKRITNWADENDKINEAQAGFRAGYSTIDNIFTLYATIQKYTSKRKGKLYVAFLDFKKAFDSVDR